MMAVPVSTSVAVLAAAESRSQFPVLNPVENVDVLGEYRRALEGRSHTTDDDELDALLAEDEQQST